jgi:3-oxoacyl-[acyl-carrier protein] reductase
LPESKRIVVVTGGSRGIGRAACLRFARDDASIIFLHYDPDDLKANETLGLLDKMGVEAKAEKLDVSSFEAVEEFFKEVVREFGRVDVLVNNAGITRDTFLVRMSVDQWDEVLTVNLKSVFNCTKAVVRSMIRERSGRIVNISSLVGQIGNSGQANYAASKAGILGFTKSVAKELATRFY